MWACGTVPSKRERLRSAPSRVVLPENQSFEADARRHGVGHPGPREPAYPRRTGRSSSTTGVEFWARGCRPQLGPRAWIRSTPNVWSTVTHGTRNGERIPSGRPRWRASDSVGPRAESRLEARFGSGKGLIFRRRSPPAGGGSERRPADLAEARIVARTVSADRSHRAAGTAGFLIGAERTMIEAAWGEAEPYRRGRPGPAFQVPKSAEVL